jgi:hypothetical protein
MYFQECLNASISRSAETKAATVVVLDIADVVQMIQPTTANTLLDLFYMFMHLVPYLESELAITVARVDTLWDTYPEENLKTLKHQYRGLGPSTRIGDGHTHIPKHELNAGFLKKMDIESERFPFLNRELVTLDLNGRLLRSTNMQCMLSNKQQEISCLQPCNHAEADIPGYSSI